MAGGFHVPSRIEGGVSFGQYRRIVGMNLAFGAGSQFGLPHQGVSFLNQNSKRA